MFWYNKGPLTLFQWLLMFQIVFWVAGNPALDRGFQAVICLLLVIEKTSLWSRYWRQTKRREDSPNGELVSAANQWWYKLVSHQGDNQRYEPRRKLGKTLLFILFVGIDWAESARTNRRCTLHLTMKERKVFLVDSICHHCVEECCTWRAEGQSLL